MSREIKFRVWDKRRNMFADKEHERDYIAISLGLHSDLCVTKELMVLQQYIGMKDCRGKEVFEGDVVKLIGGTKGGVIEYSNTRFGINIMGYFLTLNDCDFEVVGNMFENGDLL